MLRRLLMPDICFFRLPNLVFCLVELELSETLSVCISALLWLFAFPSPFLFLESIKKVTQSVCFMRWHVGNRCLGGSLYLTYIFFFWLSALMFSFVHLELIETLSVCVSILVCFSFSSSHLGIHPAGHIIGVFGDLMCLEFGA